MKGDDTGTITVAINPMYIEETVIPEASLRSSALLQLATQATGIGTWEYNIATETVTANNPTLSLFQIPASLFTGSYQQFEELVHPEDKERLHNECKDGLQNNPAFHLSFRIIRKDNTVRNIRSIVQGYYDYQGLLTHIIGTVQEVVKSEEKSNSGKEPGNSLLSGSKNHYKEKQDEASQQLGTALNGIKKIMDSSLDVICTIDEEGKFIEVSAAAQNLWGYLPEELSGKPYLDLVYEDDRENTIQAAVSVMSGNPVTVFENRYVHKSGTIMPVLWSARWEENDKIMYCIAKDATEKKKLEKTFEKEKQRLYDLFLNAPSAIAILKGPDHIYEMANTFYRQLIGENDLIGKRLNDVVLKAKEYGVIKRLDEVYHDNKTDVNTEKIFRIDRQGTGTTEDVYINFTSQPYYNFNGETEGVFVFGIDVTGEVQSRKKIEISSQRYRQIVETAQEGIWVFDQNNQTIFVNEKLCEIVGYSRDEMKGKPIDFFLHDEGIKWVEKLRQKKDEKGISHLHFRLTDKSGREVWIHISANPLFNEDGSYKGFLAMVTDITENKRTELGNRFKAELLNTIGQAVMALDLEGTILYWNKAAEQMYGWSVQEALGSHILHHGPAEQSKQKISEVISEVRNGNAWTGEVMMQRKNGDFFPAFFTETPIFDTQNNIIGMIGVSSDISERKEAEARLQDKTEKLQKAHEQQLAILNALPPNIALLDNNGVIFSVNESWKKFGKENGIEDEDSWIGQNYILISKNASGEDGYYGKKVAAKIRDVISGKINHFSMDYPCQTSSGKKWFKLVMSPLRNKAGEGVVILHIDITERKASEKKLRDQQEQLLSSQRISQVGSWQINFLDSTQLFANPILCSEETFRIFGFPHSESEISFGFFLQYIYFEDRDRVKEAFEKAISEASSLSIEFRIVQKNGSIIWVQEEAKTVVDIQTGKPVVMYGTVKDITVSKQQQMLIEKNMNERIQMVEDLTQRNKDLEQFAYIVSHNLRSPVANILGVSNILHDDTISEEEKNELGQDLIESVKKLDEVVKDLNHILQVKSKIDEVKEKVCFSQLVEDIKVSIKNLMNENEVELNYNFSEANEWVTLKSYLYSIFYNLITNSIKYRRPGIACCIEMKSCLFEDKIQLQFTDNGLGFDMSKKKKKFLDSTNDFTIM